MQMDNISVYGKNLIRKAEAWLIYIPWTLGPGSRCLIPVGLRLVSRDLGLIPRSRSGLLDSQPEAITALIGF